MAPNITIRYDHVAGAAVNSLIATWPAKSRHLAHSLIETYGTPHEATPSMLIWNYNGNWKHTIVHGDGARHNVPHPHIDILEQTVDAKVQPNIIAEIMKFDGSNCGNKFFELVRKFIMILFRKF